MRAIFLLLSAVAVFAQDHSSMPPGMSHEEPMALMKKEGELKARGAQAMGFDQNSATHHFRLTGEGGAIEVRANRDSDAETVRQIREHLRMIAADFGQGDFGKPLATHAEMPPGTSTMRELRSKIDFHYEETPNGGLVRIRTRNRAARNAVHDFLRYQIREHKTGDSESVSR